MFAKSEKYYDVLYEALGKDYAAEAEAAHIVIQKYKRTIKNSLLDVACGTGAHAEVLRKYYKYEGLDIDPAMLKIARAKFLKLKFHRGNMVDFELGKRFDAVVCLFSSIGYVKTRPGMTKAIKTMARHLLPGGVLLVEPWFSPVDWKQGSVRSLHAETPDFKVARISYSSRKGNTSLLEFHYMVGDIKGVRYFMENHIMGLFTHEEYMGAFGSAGLKTVYNKKGLSGRGLYIGVKK